MEFPAPLTCSSSEFHILTCPNISKHQKKENLAKVAFAEVALSSNVDMTFLLSSGRLKRLQRWNQFAQIFQVLVWLLL